MRGTGLAKRTPEYVATKLRESFADVEVEVVEPERAEVVADSDAEAVADSDAEVEVATLFVAESANTVVGTAKLLASTATRKLRVTALANARPQRTSLLNVGVFPEVGIEKHLSRRKIPHHHNERDHYLGKTIVKAHNVYTHIQTCIVNKQAKNSQYRKYNEFTLAT